MDLHGLNRTNDCCYYELQGINSCAQCYCCRLPYCSDDYESLRVAIEVKELFECIKTYVLHFREDNQCLLDFFFWY